MGSAASTADSSSPPPDAGKNAASADSGESKSPPADALAHLKADPSLVDSLSKMMLNDPDSFQQALQIVEHRARVDHARQELPLGSRHQLESGLCGTVRFVGPAPGSLSDESHAGHVYVFLELDAPSGNSDGVVGGVTLVEGIASKHGFFCSRHAVVAPAPTAAKLRQASTELAAQEGATTKVVRMQTLARQRRAKAKVHRKRNLHQVSKAQDFHLVDAHALKAPASARASLQKMVDYLCTPFADKPTHKARAIFRWCCENIEYDLARYHGESSSSQAPDDVLKSGKAVCSGYAGVVSSLCSLAGIPCVRISGCSKAAGYRLGMTAGELKSNHA